MKRILLSQVDITSAALAYIRDNAIIANQRPGYQTTAFSTSNSTRFVEMLIDAAKCHCLCSNVHTVTIQVQKQTNQQDFIVETVPLSINTLEEPNFSGIECNR